MFVIKHNAKIVKLIKMMVAIIFTAMFPLSGIADAVKVPSIILGADSTATGVNNFIWFGSYNNAPMRWIIIGNGYDDENSRLLLSNNILDFIQFNSADPNDNRWQSSNAQAWCDFFFHTAFNDYEKSAIALIQSKTDTAYGPSKRGYYYNECALVSENTETRGINVFFLSAEEVETFFHDNDSRKAYVQDDTYPSRWWLRSPFSLPGSVFVSSVGVVDYDGWVGHERILSKYGARPAFIINLDSVLMVSAAKDGKPDSASLSSVLVETQKDWKLTLLDSSREFTPTVNSITGVPGGTISIPYANAAIGTNENVSVLLFDDNNALFYASMAVSSASGTVTFTLPASSVLPVGTYTLKVFNEQKNGDKLSDYSSAMTDVTLIVLEAVPTTAPTPIPTLRPMPYPVPKTGDSVNIILWIGLILIGITGIAVLMILKASWKRK